MKKSELGIGVFCYNRPSHFKRVLISLEAINLKELIIFIDGAKNETDKINSEYIKFIAKNTTIKKIKIIERKFNLGLSKSLTKGIDFLSKNYNKFIVIEDDCVVYKNFLKYFVFCLDEFENEEIVNNICSFQFKEISHLSKPEYNILKLKHFLPWAWGTWSSKWQKYKKFKTNNYNNIPEFLINLNTRSYRDSKNNDIWTLSYILYQYHFKMCSIYPTYTLSKNIGFDGSGVNSKASNFFTSKEAKINKLNFDKVIYSSKLEELQKKIINKNYKLFY